LAVPNLSVKLKKPPAECSEFRWRKISDFAFNIFDLTHETLQVQIIAEFLALG
jgi:hypothetical protein